MRVVSLSPIGAGNECQRQSSVEESLLEGVDKTTFDSPGRGLLRTLEVLFQPGAVVELRAFRGRDTVSGYYDDHAALAREARKLDKMAYAVYVTLNEVDPALLARASNRTRKVYREPTTSDSDIVRRRWLPLDFDPARPSGVSATDAEKRAAKERALQVRDFLGERGWAEPVVADSGNGCHLLYRVDLPNDQESLELVKGILQSLAFRFDDDRVKVDTTTSNAARIWKLYGTTARKGDDTQERPHRLSKLLKVPEGGLVCMVVDRDKLAALAATRASSQVMSVGASILAVRDSRGAI